MSQNADTGQDLQREAEYARYGLRSSFYYRMHGTWDGLLLLVEAVAVTDWDGRDRWGISETAWSRIVNKGELPHRVFCHPSVIEAEPRLITYYRCLALLPQKGLQRLATGTQRLEEGKGRLNKDRATVIARTVNNLTSLLVDSDPNWTLQGIRMAALLNLGSQVNGSWRNEIGVEGSRRVQELVLAFALESELVHSISMDDGSQISPSDVKAEHQVRGFRFNNGFTLAFAAEPDMAVHDSRGGLVATVEVKYGLDPAGALERYGAAKKSFESATRENARVTNVYLASCITPEVRRKISDDRLVNREFNLTEVLHDSERREQFLNYIRRLVEL